MSLPGPAPAPRDSRTLVFSQRNLVRPTWHAAQYEFEDLLVGMDDVTLLSPGPLDHPQLRGMSRRVVQGLRKRAGLRRTAPLWPDPGMQASRVVSDHDLFFAVFHHSHQLSYLHRLSGWRERARRKVCLLVEVWSPGVAEEADYLELLRQFDEVYVFNAAVMPALTALGVAQPRFLPMAVDALALSPLPLVPERTIDVYSYGRRAPRTHQALLELVEHKGLTYVYDTLGDASVRDHREHRLLLANMMKRARYFLAHRINDSPERRERTGDDEALSTRYFEGAAGGAVLLGSRPLTPDFDRCFPWPDAVVPLPYDSADVGDALSDLDSRPEKVARIRADNVRGSLERNDWAHRWGQVLSDLGLPALPGLEARLTELERTASAVDPALLLDRRDRRPW